MFTANLSTMILKFKRDAEQKTAGEPMRHLYISTWMEKALTDELNDQLCHPAIVRAAAGIKLTHFAGMELHSLLQQPSYRMLVSVEPLMGLIPCR